MGEKIIYKTFDEFWGQLLQVDFVGLIPDFWDHKMTHAKWIKQFLNLRPDDNFLELACGNGAVGVSLAKLGINTICTDKNKNVLKFTREHSKDLPLEVLAEDINKLSFDNDKFHGISLFEFLGLNSKSEDLSILTNCAQWLKKGHYMAVDCAGTTEEKGEHEWEVNGGKIKWSWTFDPKTRVQNIVPLYEKDGQTIGLKENINPEINKGPGIWRYFYSIDEMMGTLLEAGLEPRQVPHYSSANHFAILGVK